MINDTRSVLSVDIVLADSNVASDALRDVKCDNTISRFSERDRASKLDGREARDIRLLISIGEEVSVSVSVAVEEKSADDDWRNDDVLLVFTLLDVENALATRTRLPLENIAAVIDSIINFIFVSLLR